MKPRRTVKSFCTDTTTFSPKRTLVLLTALSLCLQSGFSSIAEAKSSSKKMARYEQSRKLQIAKLPFSKEEEEKEASKSDSKSEQKSVVIDDIDVIEIDEDTESTEPTKASEDNQKEEKTQAKETEQDSEKEPVLLPDNALISVLKDISKALKAIDEQLVANKDEQLVVELARKILNHSLSGDGIEADRILEPEHEKSARKEMIVEAWSSGDIKVSNDLNGSVAAVWGKRIDGILNVTIAGESKNSKSSSGKSIGKFIVIVSGKSPIKKGFDIQSQTDVTFWIGKVGKIDVDAACLSKDKQEGEKEESDKTEEPSSPSADSSLKKKSLITLDSILTDRKRKFLALYASYKANIDEKRKKDQEEKKEKEQLEQEKLAKKSSEAKDKASNLASADPAYRYQYIPDQVEIIEIEEESVPDEDTELLKNSVESDYDHVQAPEDGTASNSTRKVKRTRRIRRVPRRYFNFDDGSASRMLSYKKKSTKSIEDKPQKNDEQNQSASADSQEEVINKSSKEEISSKKTQTQKNEDTKAKEDSVKQPKEKIEDKPEVSNSDNKDKMVRTEKKSFQKTESEEEKNKSKNEEEVAKTPSANQVSSDENDKAKIAIKDAQVDDEKASTAKEEQKLAKKEEKQKPKESKEEKAKPAIAPEKNTGNDLDKKLASITTIAPIKPRIEPKANPSASTPTTNKWESPAQSIIMRQPSLGANLVFPARALAGKFLTVAVIDQYGKPEPSVELSFNGATISTDTNGQAMFMVPEDATPGRTLHVSLAARPELTPGVIEVLQPLFTTTEATTPTIDKASKLVPDTKVLVIDGHDFLGMANKNRVIIDSEHSAKVIAASPVQLQLKLPQKLSCGKHKANVANSILRSTPVEFEYIKASVVEGKKAKTKRAGDVIIKVKGTEEPVSVRLTNKTPNIVKISKGNDLLITTSGGTDNSTKVDIKRLKKGKYRIDARIEI